MNDSEFTKDELESWFFCDAANGKLYWKAPLSNRIKIGDEAGSLQAGYLRVGMFNAAFQVHRLIWSMTYGKIPDNHFIDHINGNKLDNRISNLRLATRTDNNRNSASRGGRSKYKGVYWFKRDQCWQAQIQIEGIKYHIGYFETEQEAADAYEAVAKEVHGEFFSNGIREE